MENDQILIYALIDPLSNNVCYVGKTVDIKSEAKYYKKLKWIKELGALGLNPKLEILEKVNLNNVDKLRDFWKEKYNETILKENESKSELTSVKVHREIYRKFKIDSINGNVTFKELVNRAMYLYTHDENFKKLINEPYKK